MQHLLLLLSALFLATGLQAQEQRIHRFVAVNGLPQGAEKRLITAVVQVDENARISTDNDRFKVRTHLAVTTLLHLFSTAGIGEVRVLNEHPEADAVPVGAE
jgi:hypothetical protein